MSHPLRLTEPLSDALFACVYLWAHGRPCSRSELEKAARQHHDPATRCGKLVVRLMQLHGMTYEDLCDAGYLGTDAEQVKALRRSVVAEILGTEALNACLRDTGRIQRVFPAADATKTRLPLSRGSEGFDARQDYVMKHVLPAQALCSIYGPSGSFKSFLAVSWACHISAGLPWAGHRVNRGAVLYIVGEGGIGVPRRIRAWEQVYQQRVENVWLVNRPVFPVRQSEVQEVILAAKQIASEGGLPVRLIVIDTLARCFGGNDENDARDMGAFIEGCDDIKRKTGATVLVVHHSGKDEAKGARGSSAFRAALDAEFQVRREDENIALILTCTKMKDAEEPKRRAYDLQPVRLFTDEEGEEIHSLAVRDVARDVDEHDPHLSSIPNLSENHATLWALIRSRTENGDACTRALLRDDMKAMGIDVSKNFSRWLAKLESHGMLTVNDEEITIISCRKSEG
ncbi:helicase RepA family protein [Pantoea dispersa]|uniref:helicase RepA family protein n=1 Tax=Pantoea dispersa TaxID=59814 RepID=UPI002DB7A28C|nr:helicase RepA family protein [Pantoea dispersa]MEB5838466.1 helicase RepA family protein [Pantoea dispersa]